MPIASLPTGIDMYYEVEGSGDPLVLIMGTNADHTTWAAQVESYRDSYQVITYDARGTGQSTHPEPLEDYSMKILADDAVNGFLFELPKIGVWDAKLEGMWENSPIQATDLTDVKWAD